MAEPDTTLNPPRGPGSTVRRVVFLSLFTLFVVFVLVAFRAVLLPFVLAVLVAYLLAPVVHRLEQTRVGSRGLPRWAAVLIVYGLLLGVLAVGLANTAPRLGAELSRLVNDLPQLTRKVQNDWLPKVEHTLNKFLPVAAAPPKPVTPPKAAPARVPPTPTKIYVIPRQDGIFEIRLPAQGLTIQTKQDGLFSENRTSQPAAPKDSLSSSFVRILGRQVQDIQQHAITVFHTARKVLALLVQGIFNFFLTLMLSAFLLVTSDRIFAFVRTLVRPHKQEDFTRLIQRIDLGLAGVVRGQLLICAVNGVLSGIGFYIADLPHWPILTFIATALSVIPIFGAILSSVPAVVIALQQGIGVAIFVLLWIVGIHQLEANVLNPKILGDAAKVHPVLVVFALLAGEHAYGIVGALLAVPVLSVLQSLFLHYREVALGTPAPLPPKPNGSVPTTTSV